MREISPFVTRAAFMLLALLLSGGDPQDDYRLAFSHALHVTDNEMACADCHGEMAEGRFVPVGHASCQDCHSDWIETEEVNAETCGMCHRSQDLQELSRTEPARPVPTPARVFRHSSDLSDRCADCHGSLLDKDLNRVPERSRQETVRLRNQAHQWGLSCTACHADLDPKTPPPSHAVNWTRQHGTMGTQPDNTCGMCHRDESCRECHQSTEPASHNTLWRTKTHGVNAAWDRARCRVCHEQDSCDACHASNRPRSHTAAWARTHCLNCHPSGETGTGCTLCHETDIGSHPNPHAAGWRSRHCDSCHEGSPEAEQCGVCHDGGGTLATHPNPHSVGWQDRHCYNCHPGSPAGDACVRCHEDGSSIMVHQDVWPSYHNRFAASATINTCFFCHEP